jgi:hypothetical protein
MGMLRDRGNLQDGEGFLPDSIIMNSFAPKKQSQNFHFQTKLNQKALKKLSKH